MATAKLTKLWAAVFDDGHVICQPEDDRYSKHDDNASWNPSAFRDVLEYDGKLVFFILDNVAVDIVNGLFCTHPGKVTRQSFSLELEPLIERKLIYFRVTDRDYKNGVGQEPFIAKYVIGYEGKNAQGVVEKKVIYVDP